METETNNTQPNNSWDNKATNAGDDKKPVGPTVGLVIVIIIIIAGGIYFWKERGTNTNVMTDEQAMMIEKQDSSDEINAIEADLNATSLDSIDASLDSMDAELEAQ